MNQFDEVVRIAARVLLCIVAFFAAAVMYEPPHNSIAAPICFAVAVAGLACSCRPAGPPA